MIILNVKHQQIKARSIQIEHRSRNQSCFVHKSLNTNKHIYFLNVYHTNKDDQEAGDTDIMSAKIGQDLLTSLKIKD